CSTCSATLVLARIDLVFEMVDVIVDMFFFSSRRRHTRSKRDWSSDVCSSDLIRMRPKRRRCSLLYRSGCGRHLYAGLCWNWHNGSCHKPQSPGIFLLRAG